MTASKRFIKFLYKIGDLKLCVERACNLVELYPEEIYAYEWICKIYCEHYNSSRKACLDSLKNTIDFYATKLLELNENSSLGLFVKAISLYNSQQFVAARNFLYKVQNVQQNYELALQLLAFSEMQLEAYELAEKIWYQLKAHNSTELAICLSYSEEKTKLNEAVEILKTKETSNEVNQILARYVRK